MSTIRIVPPTPSEDGITLANGTRVYTAKGEQIHGITSITITAKVGDIWRATIECMVTVPELHVEVEDPKGP